MKPLEGPGPLQGIRVLEFSHVIAGPFTGLQLARLGAEVIKVEPAGGDFLASMRHGRLAYEALNDGKQVRQIDITQAAGLAEVLALVGQADVMIDSYSPGSLARKGLGYEALAARHPGLVYCSISGYGSEHPGWGARGAYDHVVQAMTGMARQNGEEGDPPIKVGFPVTDTATGMAAVSAIMAALMTRYRSGRGQYLEVSMARVALQLLFPMACDSAVTGIDAPRIGNTGYSGSVGAGFFETRDGWLALGANTAAQLERALTALGYAGDEARVRESPAVGVAKPRETRSGPAALLRDALQALDADAAEALLDAAGVPVARLRSLTGFLRDAVAAGWLADGGDSAARWSQGLSLGWRAFATDDAPGHAAGAGHDAEHRAGTGDEDECRAAPPHRTQERPQ